MLKDNRIVLEELRGERDAMQDKLMKLSAFIYSEAIDEVPEVMRTELHKQHGAMHDYLEALTSRIGILRRMLA